MNASKRVVIVLAVCAIAFSAACATAQDWPQWRGPDRDGIVADFNTPEVWPPDLTVAWTATVGTGDATPALVGDRLYVFSRQGDDEVALCLNAADGSELWRNAYAAEPPTGASGRHPGPRSSAAVADGMMVTLGVRSVVSCLNTETGEVVWRGMPMGNTAPKFFTSMSPLITDGMVIVQLGSEDSGGMVALDLATGDEQWRWEGAGTAYASPALMTVGDTTQVVTLTSSSVAGISLADGSLLWEIPFVPEGRAYNAATPIIDGDTVIYTGAGRGTHRVRIVPGDDGFSVEPVWDNADVAVQYDTPVVQDGLLFGLSNSGNLFCLDAATGETKWIVEESIDRGGFGPIVSTGDALFVLPSGGDLIAFAPTGDAYTELARMKVSDTPTYAHPVLSGNRIFIKGEDALTAWMLQ